MTDKAKDAESGTRLKQPPRGNRAAKDQAPAAGEGPKAVPGVVTPPRQDNQDLPDKKATVCPVCQYRFEPGTPVL